MPQVLGDGSGSDLKPAAYLTRPRAGFFLSIHPENGNVYVIFDFRSFSTNFCVGIPYRTNRARKKTGLRQGMKKGSTVRVARSSDF